MNDRLVPSTAASRRERNGDSLGRDRTRASKRRGGLGFFVVGLGLLGAFALCADPASAIDATVQVEGQTQGPFPGTSTNATRPNESQLFGFADALSQPFGSTGAPSGARTHRPIVFRKAVDENTPRYAQALASAETLPQVDLRFYGVNPVTSALEVILRIHLTNARVVAITRAAGTGDPELTEQISVVFQSIEWSHPPKSVVSSDTGSF